LSLLLFLYEKISVYSKKKIERQLSINKKNKNEKEQRCFYNIIKKYIILIESISGIKIIIKLFIKKYS